MAKLVHCDGCGMTEPDDTPTKKRKIKPTTMSIVTDARFPEGTMKYEADLCENCRGMMLHTYFKIPAEGSLELPAFLGPRMLDNDTHSRRSDASSQGQRRVPVRE